MHDEDVSILEDKELFNKLQQVELADKLIHSPEWKLLKVAADRIIERALERFALAMKADDLIGVMETQLLLRKYKYGLFSELDQLAQEGELYYEELKDRGAFDRTGKE